MEINETIHGFRLTDKKYVKEADSTVHMFEHAKTGARLLYMENDDDNKVFSVSFKTNPHDSTGVAHIIEHSVLCGSGKYPLKDPFVKLMNSSLNTFLNAMTFMDKTMYPVASLNEKDFANLVDVYCDAVFNPLIKKDDTAFLQEGWHYELKDGKLTVNGIVYNEMKGVYSDPEEVLSETVGAALFPDTIYAYDSGGDPDVIPSLTYEDYLRFYSDHYNPSNSYIFIYGNTDIDARLRDLDERYLSKYERTPLPEAPMMQEPFENEVFVERTYNTDGSETREESCYFAKAWAFSDAPDIKTVCALNVLVKILFDTDSSPLKKALTDTGIADEIVYDFATGTAQPYFTVAAKNADIADLDVFTSETRSVLERLASGDISDELILASLNNYEFDLREADHGSYPKGLVDCIRIMESWLYGKSPLDQLEYEDTLSYLRQHADREFFGSLIRKYFLENTHSATVVLAPEEGLSKKKAADLEMRLNEKYSSLTEDEKASIISDTERLRIKQSTPDSAEALSTIPVLDASEIDRLPKNYVLTEEKVSDSRIFTYTDVCSGIAYTDFCFDITDLTEDEISMLDLVTETLGVYGTLDHPEEKLANLIGIYLGDADASASLIQNITSPDKYAARFVLSVKALSSNMEKMFDLAGEILTRTVYNDPARLLQTVNEEISKFTYNLVSGAESIAAIRIASAFTPRGYFKELEKGQTWYRRLLKIRDELSSEPAKVLGEMNSLLGKIINANGLDVLITCDGQDEEAMRRNALRVIGMLPSHDRGPAFLNVRSDAVHEGIITPSDVCYAGLGANIKSLGMEVPSTIAFTRKLLRTGYLWDRIRVKGGAYGAILSTDRGGDIVLMSYRDPNVASTYKVYEGIADELRGMKLTAKEINDLTIGTMSDVDMPVIVYNRGRRALNSLYSDNSWEAQCAVREKLLSVKPSDVTDAAEVFSFLCEKGMRVSMAPEAKINEADGYFIKKYSIK